MEDTLKRLRTAALLLVSFGLALAAPLYAQGQDAPTLNPSKLLTQYVHDQWMTDDGLPQSTVNTITQTPDGYLWLGTEEGLARFDGQAFTVYDGTNTAAFERSHAVKQLYVDQKGGLWIATRGGGLIRLYDKQFSSYGEQEGWPSAPVSAIYQDQSEGLWIGTYGSGLYYHQRDTTSRFSTDEGLASPFVTDLAGDIEGQLWIGTDEGVHRYAGGRMYTRRNGPDDHVNVLYGGSSAALWIGTRTGLHRIDPTRPDAAYQEIAVSAPVLSLHQDRERTLWMGLDGQGLGRLRRGRLETFPDDHILAHARIFALFEDREGNLWIGTEGHGLHRIRDGKFTLYTTAENLSNDMVLSVSEGSDGSMWIGTEGGGLNRLKDGRITTYTTEDGLPSDRIASVYGDRRGGVWIGTLGGGLSRWAAGEITTYTVKDGLPSNAVFAIYEDADEQLWIGTDAGLAMYDGSKVVTYTRDDGLSSNLITAVLQDRRGDLWAGTYDGGLNRLRDDAFTSYDEADGLGSNLVLTLHEDVDGVLWIGTYEGGLTRLKQGEFTTFTTREGLFSDNIYQILEDGQQNLWMTSNKGIFSVEKGQLTALADDRIDTLHPVSYGRADGLMNAELNGGSQPAGWRSRDGRLWFPTIHGVAVADPDDIRRNGLAPPVVIEQILADRVEVSLRKSPHLAPGKRKLEFHYAALSLVAPEKVRYRYKLEGFDEDWVDAGLQRAATYTNLPPGEYTFRVTATNNDGVWNEEGASVRFHLKPFFYQTPLFWLLLAFAFCVAAVMGHRLRIRHLRARQRELEVVVAARTKDLKTAKDRIEEQADKLRDLDRFKTQFFANVSHEFRTPLTMIVGPLENLLSGTFGTTSSEVQRQMQIMLRNALRLMRLINQLLDLSKLEEGKMTLRTRTRNFVAFLEGIVVSCTAFAEKKNIALEFIPSSEHLEMWFEPDKLEKVFFNLLSNASKFTPEGGSITVVVSEKPGMPAMPEGAVEVRVRDSGTGIPAEELSRIFDRFHQVDGSNTRRHEGTGIGLAFARELVLLHHGTIEVESEVGAGTEFVITLPLGSAHLGPEEMDRSPDGESAVDRGGITELASAAFDFIHEHEAPSVEDVTVSRDAPTLLVVEDNKDVREYVTSLLAGDYRVESAGDGKEGLEMAAAIVPDLIISDVMMPKMDGNELCRRIKTSPALNHIPVLLLTARATQETKIEGLEVGADDYVAKPFNAQELRVRIRNLLQIRRQEKALKDLNEKLEDKVQEQFQVLVNERQRYERDLLSAKERAEASDRLKSSILNNLSHEFRTPLTAILGYSEILSEETDELHRELSQEIENGGRRLLDTLDALLDLSVLEAGEIETKLEWNDLAAAAHEAATRIRAIADEKDLDVQVRVQSDEPVFVRVDAEDLAKLFDKLLDNAVKFTEKGEIEITVDASDEAVRVAVRDTGRGIAQEFIPQVFTAFAQESDGLTRSHEGVGLGLTITKQLVELYDGTITVASDRKEGTVVTVSFPTPRINEERADSPSAPAFASAGLEIRSYR